MSRVKRLIISIKRNTGEFLTLKTSQLGIFGCFFIRKTLIIFASEIQKKISCK